MEPPDPSPPVYAESPARRQSFAGAAKHGGLRPNRIFDDTVPAGIPILNALSVDVEEHFHAGALARALPRSMWDCCESRVVANTRRMLDLFARRGAYGTFFTLGSVARHHPDLVRAIAAGGHEIASHGYDHFRVGEQSPRVFAEDVERTRKILEDVSGQPVVGYRAANFSIDHATAWAHEALTEAGYRYSSSVNPIAHDHYGVRDAPHRPFRPDRGNILEIPITTVAWCGLRWPAGGGGYFRIAPYALWRRVVGRVNVSEGRPANFFIHPWEIDPHQPRAKVGGLARFRHYVNLDGAEAKLDQLLAEFRWDRIDRVYGAILTESFR